MIYMRSVSHTECKCFINMLSGTTLCTAVGFYGVFQIFIFLLHMKILLLNTNTLLSYCLCTYICPVRVEIMTAEIVVKCLHCALS